MCGFVIFALSLSKNGDTWSVDRLVRCSDDCSLFRSTNTKVNSFCQMSRRPIRPAIPDFETMSQRKGAAAENRDAFHGLPEGSDQPSASSAASTSSVVSMFV